MRSSSLLRRLRRYLARVRLKDAVIVSFPKAGRTWLRMMLDELELPVIHTHAGAKRAEVPERTAFAGKRVILLIRDPRDTVVSAYHQETKRVDQQYPGSISDFIRDPRMGIERIVEFNLAWLGDCNLPKQFYLLEYERLRSDTLNELQGLLSFLGAGDKTRADMQRVTELTEFSRMQRLEKEGSLSQRYGESLTPRDTSDINSFKVRKGKVGGYRDELTEADVEYCNAVMAKHEYRETVAAYRSNLQDPRASLNDSASASASGGSRAV